MSKIKTNADRIRHMTDEELVEFMEKLECQDVDFGITFCGEGCEKDYECNDCRKWWLKQPYHPESYYSKAIKDRRDNF